MKKLTCPDWWKKYWSNWKTLASGEEGMSTAEYAIGTIAAAAFAGLLLAVIQGGGIQETLTSLIQRALTI